MNTLRRRVAPVDRERRSFLVALGVACSGAARAQAPATIHGADNVFANDDVGIVWAVLKDDASGKASVWLRLVQRSGRFTRAAIDGVDPFSKARRRLQTAIVLEPEARVAADRAGFDELPSREIHFYGSPAELSSDRAALTVYYLGVPDTTPEFTSRAALDRYLSEAPLRTHPVAPR